MPIILRMATEFIQDETPLLASRQILNGVLPYCVSYEKWTDNKIVDYSNKLCIEFDESKKIRNFNRFFKFVPALVWVTSVMLNSSIYLSKEFLTKAFQLKRIMVHEIRGDIHHLMKCPAEIVTLNIKECSNPSIRVLRKKLDIDQTVDYELTWKNLHRDKILIPPEAKSSIVPQLRIKSNKHWSTATFELAGRIMTRKEFMKIEKDEFKPLRTLRHFMVPSLSEYFDYKKFLERKGTPLRMRESFKYPGTKTRAKYSLGGWTKEAITKNIVGVEEVEYELTREDRLEEEYWEKHW